MNLYTCGEKAGTHHNDKTVERQREERAGHPIERTQTLKKNKIMPMRYSPKRPKHYNTVRSKSSLQSQDKNSSRTLSLSFLPVPSTSQCCLSQLTHQILHTNIEQARRKESTPTILAENVGAADQKGERVFPVVNSVCCG